MDDSAGFINEGAFHPIAAGHLRLQAVKRHEISPSHVAVRFDFEFRPYMRVTAEAFDEPESPTQD